MTPIVPGVSELLKEFGHYFELMAGANGAFIFSSEISQHLVTKMVTPLSNIQDELNLLITLIEDKEKFIIDNNDKCKVDATSANLYKTVSTKTLETKKEAYDLSQRLQQIIDRFKSKKFSYLSFFSMLYCIFILLVIGFKDESSDFSNWMFLFNITTIIFLCFYLLSLPKFFKPTYLKMFLYPLIIAVLIILAACIWGHFNGVCPIICNSSLFQISCLFIPIMHFIYMFGKAVYKGMRDSKNISREYWIIKDKHTINDSSIYSLFETVIKSDI